MSPMPTARGPRRGATRRRQPRRDICLFGGAKLDRWLDRLVDIAVIVALVVGGVALLLTLLL
ncbi:hypothetical protein ACM26W_03370 [Halomonas sp. HK25]|uniref:hypothetical protein n=1 Tax=Halomonas sp. HK25 TaxID=3394321 RepID=UPI0039FC2F21